ncbi:hypothetical protein [Neptunomonas japonica]|uniref:hypothetical protein n=1 Tax=Neptunomonas japonica TaxID=417574 RepID=UPI000405F795|nr:hypothetical protein [Neptunomonas japonica]
MAQSISIYRFTKHAQLKRSVETAIDELIESLKMKYGIKKSVEVVYAVNGFYLLAIEKD